MVGNKFDTAAIYGHLFGFVANMYLNTYLESWKGVVGFSIGKYEICTKLKIYNP